MSKFYAVRQNNSGGYFIRNNDVDHYVIIEAESYEDFKERADNIFSDYRSYCSCCGERWDDNWIDEDDATDEPLLYEGKPEDHKYFCDVGGTIIYFLNGTRTHYLSETNTWEIVV